VLSYRYYFVLLYTLPITLIFVHFLGTPACTFFRCDSGPLFVRDETLTTVVAVVVFLYVRVLLAELGHLARTYIYIYTYVYTTAYTAVEIEYYYYIGETIGERVRGRVWWSTRENGRVDI
jgi:hypothetical protein